MAEAFTHHKDIRALRELAQNADLLPTKARRSFSRGAALEAIDQLSRWSIGGLASISGVSIFLAVNIGQSYPARATAWALLVFLAIWACRRTQARFRRGVAMASKPFRWRATFAACLTVLGVAFASAPILLTPATAETTLALQTTTLVFIGSFGAAVFFASHINCALAVATPATIFPLLAAWRNGDGITAIYYVLAAIAGMASIIGLNIMINRIIAKRRPRTSVFRQSAPQAGENLATDDTANRLAEVLFK